MIGGVILPTQFRHLSDDEWDLVVKVFDASNLPYRFRIYIANGIGLYNVPFTVPTSVISSALIAAGISNPVLSVAGPVGLATAPVRMLLGAAAGQGASIVNAGYVINVGDYYADTLFDAKGKRLLVHEMTHVWQGKSNWFALTATLGSLAAQCKGMSTKHGFDGRNQAYDYTISSPPQAWGSFNPEQQANIVEDWYRNGSPTDGNRWPYIQDYVRKGKTS